MFEASAAAGQVEAGPQKFDIGFCAPMKSVLRLVPLPFGEGRLEGGLEGGLALQQSTLPPEVQNAGHVSEHGNRN